LRRNQLRAEKEEKAKGERGKEKGERGKEKQQLLPGQGR